eukprot:TRINITY_DN15_c0_g3_i1.p2 TRINITY_DN15_c0_g3~~TRINITY_DN15_c0_g3_i1.p2  ORF type:complete len:314 (+),score=52.30 TRINITY_DN15_c0_g3_i1:65-1006(+)
MKFADFIKNANWPMVIYISLVHIAAIIGLYYLPSVSFKTIVWGFITYVLAGVGITGGAHRLWAHRSYSAHWTVRVILMLCNSMASQGTIFHWARDHRVHHKYSETPADPHNATRGLFFSHVGWLLVKKDPKVTEAGRKMNMEDLIADPVVQFQKRYDPWWNLTWCFVIPGLVPYFGWNESLAAGIFVCGALRYALVLHATWTVNSVAHQYGDRPYDKNINPRENGWVSFFALGEGWHNWHHKYPYDYATSEFGCFRRLNPTKVFIDTCAFFGLVWGRKRAVAAWELAQKKLAENSKSVKNVAEGLQNTAAFGY